MYIIVSTSFQYKGKIVGTDCIIRANTIGHEIHMTRPLVFFLLTKKLISGEDDVIVTKSKERFFFYSKFFKNIIEYDNMPTNIDEKDILDLTHSNSLCEEGKDENQGLLDMEIKLPILYEIRKNNLLIRSDLFTFYLSELDFPIFPNFPIFDFLSSKFIVIHNRDVSYNNVSQNIDITKFLLEYILTSYPELIIVVFSIKPIDYVNERVKYISEIPIYASLMNHENCQAVVSEFSGAGQLSQYCHHKNIIYYFHAYFFSHNNNLQEIIDIANHPNNIYYRFDLKKYTKSNIFIYKNIYELLINLVKDNLLYATNNNEVPVYRIF